MIITRRAALLGFLVARFAYPQKDSSHKKWYITGGRRDSGQGDCDISPIVAYGKDRMDALANSGLTVWSEDEYLRSDPAKFFADCKRLRVTH